MSANLKMLLLNQIKFYSWFALQIDAMLEEW